MDLPIGIPSDEFWQRHIDQMYKFKGSQREYASQNGVTLSQLHYYRYKFRKKAGFAKVIAIDTKRASAPKTALSVEPKVEPKKTVENSDTYPQRLPDARWVAQLIRELLR
jgi:hypothetical protein